MGSSEERTESGERIPAPFPEHFPVYTIPDSAFGPSARDGARTPSRSETTVLPREQLTVLKAPLRHYQNQATGFAGGI
jgi:hypothetical protein